MKKFIIFLIFPFLCFLPIQTFSSNHQQRQPDEVYEKIFNDLTEVIGENLKRNDFSDWKLRISSFGRAVQILEKIKQRSFQKCYSNCRKKNASLCTLPKQPQDCNSLCNNSVNPEDEESFYTRFLKELENNQIENQFIEALKEVRKQRNVDTKPIKNVSNHSLNKLLVILLVLLTIFILVGLIIFKHWYPTFKKKKSSTLPHQRNQTTKPIHDRVNDPITTVTQGKLLSKENKVSDIATLKQSDPQLLVHGCEGITTNSIVNQFWRVVGASVIGKSHLDNVPPLPCQDSHYLEEETDNRPKWGVAVVCDGAGSATHSHLGAQFVAEKTAQYFKKIVKKRVEDYGWYKKEVLPIQEQWHYVAKKVLGTVRDDLESYAKEKNIEVKMLACTVIVVIFSPAGLLVTHIGDGRGGYRSAQGEWKSFLTPFKGEEANQTTFITSDIWNDTDKYIESRVINERTTAFVVMSDGCESHCFQTYNPDEASKQFRLIDINKPHAKFFEPLFNTINAAEIKDNEDEKELRQKWADFIQSGTEGLKNELDDKTMILGIFKV